ncbi:MAG TPA: TonB-dependent receptor [Steroidobacteraceae bacterium]|nr:TonB-dependent receptor [Steroidobacteraceae bacterium]
MKQYASRALLVPFAMTVAFCPPVAAAAAASETSGQLEEVTVTARKISENVENVPESMTVLTQGTIESAGISNVVDIVNLTPNFIFDAQPTPGAFQFTVRGISMAQGGEAPVAFVVDGVEVPDPVFIDEELLNVAQIQVLRGPQGSLYGRNALAGAIIIDTQQPTDQPKGSVKARFGNGDERYFNGVLSGPIAGDVLTGSLAISSHHFGGLIENNFLHETADSLEDKAFFGRLVYKPTDALTISARVNLITKTDRVNTAEIVSRDQFSDYSQSFISENVAPVARQRLLDTSVKIDDDMGFATLTSITAYNSAHTNLSGDGDFTPAPILLQNVTRNVFSRSEELRLAASPASAVKWVVGAFFQNRDVLNALVIPFDDGTGKPNGSFALASHDDGTSKSYAGFGQATTEVLPKTDLTLGLRYDSDKRTSSDANFAGSGAAKTFSATQPKVSLEYHWTSDFQTYLSAAKGFRSGGFNAFFSVGTPTRDYGEQIDKNYEFGFKGRFLDRRLSVDGAFYHTDVDNQQLFFINANPPSQNVTTIDKAKINGGELEIAAEIAQGFQLSAGMGLADSKIVRFALSPDAEGKTVPLSPTYTAQIGASYSHPLPNGWTLASYANIHRRGPIYWDSLNTLSTQPRDALDLRISLQSEHFFITPFGRNLLNEQYPTSALVDGFGPGRIGRFMSEPRTYGVELGTKF